MKVLTESLLIPLVAALTATQVSSFSTGSPMIRTMTNRFGSPSIRNAGLIRASSADAGDDSMKTYITKQLGNDEAKLLKGEEKAMVNLYLNGTKLTSNPAASFSETAARYAVKALMWRAIAGSMTFIASLKFCGSIVNALSIVVSDFLSKSFTLSIGERIMNKSQAGRTFGVDGSAQPLVTALALRLFAICNTLTMAVWVAKDISTASKIAGFDAIFKTPLMFFYERAWVNVEWGKEYQVEYNI